MVSSRLLFLAEVVLRPALRVFVRYGLPFQTLVGLARERLVQAAADHIARRGETVNMSRLSALTGIRRADIAKSTSAGKVDVGDSPISFVGNLMGMWQQRAEFRDADGRPRPLRYRGEQSDFRRLVAAVDATVPSHVALFQLEQLGFAELRGDEVTLLKERIEVHADPSKAYEVLGRGLESLVTCVLENVHEPAPIKNLHLHSEFDNIFLSDVPRIREWLLREGREFHRRAREFIAQCDADLNPDIEREQLEPERARVVLTAFSLTAPVLPSTSVPIEEIRLSSKRGRPRRLVGERK